jgi:hypothetical protein
MIETGLKVSVMFPISPFESIGIAKALFVIDKILIIVALLFLPNSPIQITAIILINEY